ncbi:MAG: hypothetical protein FWJ74_00980 [Gemmatimonadota bacterium]
MIYPVGALRLRRAGYARYAELIVAQIEALRADDLERFRALAEERDAVARRIDAIVDDDLTGDDSEDRANREEVDRLIGEVRLLLEQCRDHDQQLREELARMRDEAREALGDLDRRRPQVEAYVRAPDAGTRFDVRL